MKLVLSIVSALAALGVNTVVEARFPANESSYLNFVIPPSLRKNDTAYEHQPAHFGSHFSVFAKDANLVQKVYYDADDNFCSPEAPPPAKNSTKKDPWAPPFIALIDRGACTFVTKVRNAQRRGASAVILADNKDESEIHVVADDGSGHDISIPSVMMKKSDADAVKHSLGKKHTVIVEMAWHWPKHTDHATIEYWYNPNSLHSAEFLGNFSNIVQKLGDNMQFEPHHHILDGVDMNCHGKTEKETDFCYNLCTNNGRYCAIGHHGVLGKDVVIESLRRMCVQKHYPGAPWWAYLSHFTQQCMEQKDEVYFANEDCLKDAFSHASIDQATIDTCMKDSGDITSDSTNTMLEAAMTLVEEFGAFESPTVLVNGAPLNWMPVTPKTVFDVYCHAFEYGKAPHACYQCEFCGDPVACIARDPMECHPDDGKEPEDGPSPAPANNKGKGGVKGRHWGWFFIFCCMGGAGGYVYYKRRVEGEDGFGSYSLADAFMSDSA
mmetsp:Transcript_5372/g.12673  ORF Transcript_5372/g.12673 Transcript_5372/m.12673 type:complete len:494 (-) Transcript_5372:207-1688(-)|eukprot:CAMPEP_0113643216 /NCGR_PEP_ID=MMETSP0017_2-20120614/22717_1 /TAXON_ID=2856 /ORGANISM="Cylindrotheca closterium" /LENGTH=493 /DNA_ID=CAMNT_0000554707 /DNA_START=45 /DNA_END=1526 /DNA_ORIENTATION=+ /assembly_acc=CAM_ASM_000147